MVSLFDTIRDKVLRAAHELGYRMTQREPLAPALADAPDERNLIVYLADEISTSPQPVVSIDGARDAAFAHGRMLAVYSTHGNADIEARVLGVIYATVSRAA